MSSAPSSATHIESVPPIVEYRAALSLAAPVRASSRDAATLWGLRLADLAGAAAAAFVAFALTSGPNELATALVFVVATLLAAQAFGLHRRETSVLQTGVLDELPRILQAPALSVGGLAIVGPLVGRVPADSFAVLLLSAAVTLSTSRAAVRAVIRRATADERILILGSGQIAELVADKCRKHPELGVDVVGCLDVLGEPTAAAVTVPHLGTLDDVDHVIEEQRIDSVIIAFSAVHHEQLLQAIHRCRRRRVKVSVVPRLFEVIGSRVDVHDIQGLTVLGLRGSVRSRGTMAAKRAFDVTAAALALLVLTPLLVAIALAIKLTSRGPVLFRQERIGRRQRPFAMLKFRTMVQGADAMKADLRHLNEISAGPMFKIADDPRCTRVGRFLRMTSLDELPQFVNVLRGEMSVVGPRPLIREEDDAVLGWHRARLDLTPGLTGPWQVMGRQHVPFSEMVKLDYLYVAEWSFWNDIKLALRTVPLVWRRTGA